MAQVGITTKQKTPHPNPLPAKPGRGDERRLLIPKASANGIRPAVDESTHVSDPPVTAMCGA